MNPISRAEHQAILGELATGLAHDIRNPMTGIIGVLDIVARDLPASSPASDVLREAQDEATRVIQLLTELTDYARPKPLDLQLVDLNETAELGLLLARQRAHSRAVDIEFRPAASVLDVSHDPARIQQVVLSLLLGALHAAGLRDQGHVQLVVETHADAAAIKVSDNGPGIAAADLSRVFRPFFASNGRKAGLGMALAWSTIEQHGGVLIAESVPDGRTTFTLTLPLA